MTLLPWQEAAAERVRNLDAAGRLPHALLVTAPDGWGEVSFANWLTLELLGLPPDQPADAVAHPDLRWVKPEGALIKVEAVRDVAQFAVGTPQLARRKVAVLEHAHALNANAANALLKTLEEPPPNTHLLLVTAHPGRLLATIRSRCQQLRITPDAEAARRWLESRAGDAALDDLLFEYGSAPLHVIAGLERGEQPLTAALARALRERHPAAAAQSLLSQDPVALTGRWFRHCLGALAGADRVEGLTDADPRAVLDFTDELVSVRRQLETSNSANARLLLERLLVRWRTLAPRPGRQA